MKGRRVLTFEEALSAGEGRLGGKAFGLARLDGVDFVRVPGWFAIDSAVSVGHLGRAEVLEDILQNFGAEDLEAFSARVGAKIVETELTDVFCADVGEELKRLGDGPYAVRSSMVGEDSASLSFAGQLSSYLYLRSAEEVLDAIRRCWASAFSPHALKYRRRAAEESGTPIPRVGVIVQRMITGEVSGVVFTAHPVTGRRDHVLVHAAWGLAEGVVSGATNVDEFVWSRADGEVSSIIADKDLKVVGVADGKDTVEVATDEESRKRRCLTPEEVELVAETASCIADAFGVPQDIEWTIANGELHILQSRPITALPLVQNESGPRVVFDNSNIQESYCGVTTPLTYSFAQGAYASVYEQTMRAVRIPDSVIDAHRDTLRNLIGLVRGRVYYNINNWYRGLLLLPSFGRNKDDMEAMMGLDVPVDFVEDQVLSLSEKLRRLPSMLITFGWLLAGFRSLPKAVPRFLADFDEAYARIDRESFGTASFSEVMEILARLRAEMLENWTTPIINDFYVMMAMGRLRRLVASCGVPNPDEITNNLLSGEEGIESLEPTRVLMRLARDAGAEPDLVELLREDPPEETWLKIHDRFPEFAAAVDDYIERYGDRVIGELKLETITAREDPSFVVRVLRNYLARPDLDPDRLATHELMLRGEAEEALFGSLGMLGKGKARRTVARARQAVKNRENMRLARTRMFGLFRDAYRAIGGCLFEAGKLDDPRDVFYLTTDEILAYFEGRAASAMLGPLVAARKREFETYETQDLPHHFETRGPVYHGNLYAPPMSEEVVDTNRPTLQGTGCYPGRVEAPLRVVMSPADNLDMSGHILTTLRTDPGWAPLFPAAAGILVERGSTLSHSAVVARELGIPAIVGVPGLLATVRDGEHVVLDGSAGTVQRLDHQNLDIQNP
ncbi:MAG: PEP/pyruvate-binding domain-containing protein [Bradymonadaceae bacterium]